MKKMNVTLKNNGEKAVIGLLVLFFLLIAFCFFQANRISFFLEIILFLGVVCIAIYIKNARKDLKVQFLIVNLLFSAIWIAGILCKETRKEKLVLIAGGITCLLIAVAAAALSLLHEMCWQDLRKYIGLFIICSAFGLMSLEVIDEVPMYDGGAYYYWSIIKLAPQFDFSPENIIDYCLAGHISVGYSLFALLGELISPYTSMGVHLINILLAVCAIIAFYKSLEIIFPFQPIIKRTLAAGVFAVMPNMLGMIGTVNVDVPGIYFFTIMWYCYLRKYKVLELFFAWVFVCTKEPNVIYYFFFVLGVIFIEAYEEKRKAQIGIIQLLRNEAGRQILRIIPMIFWFIYYIAPGRNSWVAGSEGLLNTSGLHTFGFSVTNLAVKLKEIMIFNFGWVFIVLILFSALKLWLSVRKEPDNLEKWVPLISAMAGVLLFNIFYLDYPHPRYLSIGNVILSMTAILIFLSVKGTNIMLGVVMLMMLIQSFVSADPLTWISFYTVNYSDAPSRMVSTELMAGSKLSDGAIYNREYSYWQGVLNRILKKAQYTSDTIIVFPAFENIPKAYGYELYWNFKKNKIQTCSSEETIPVTIAADSEEVKLYDRILYIIPFYEQQYEKLPDLLDDSIEFYEVTFRTLSAKYAIGSSNHSI